MRYGAKGPPPQPPFPQAYRHVVDGHAHGTVVVDLLGGHALGLVRQEDAQQQEQPLEAIKYPWWGRIKGKRGGVTHRWSSREWGTPLICPPWVSFRTSTPTLLIPQVLLGTPSPHHHQIPACLPQPPTPYLDPPRAHRATCSSWWSCSAPAGAGWRRPCPSWAPLW